MTTLWTGLSTGALYALIAIGYNIVLLSSGVLNFAFAAMVMVGTFIAYWSAVTLGLPVLVAVLIGAVVVGLLAAAEERLAVRRLLAQHRHLTALIVTIGVSILLEGLAQVIWGREPLRVPGLLPDNTITLFGGSILPNDLLLIILVLIIGLTLHFATTRTIFGLAALATAEDDGAAGARGIDVKRISLIAFTLAGVLAGAVGAIVGVHTYATYDLGNSLAILGIVAIALGGSGNQLGGVLGGFATGLIYTYAARYLDASWGEVVVFAVLLFVLLVRPTGLFQTAARTERLV